MGAPAKWSSPTFHLGRGEECWKMDGVPNKALADPQIWRLQLYNLEAQCTI